MVNRRTLTATTLLALASFAASINLIFAALVRMGAEFDVKPERLASISAVYYTGFFVNALLAGYFSDRYGAKRVILAGCLFTTLGGLMFMLSATAMSLLAGALVMGMGSGVIEGMCTALLAHLYPDRERFAINLSQAGYCLGAVVGPFLMGIFIPRGVSWRLFFLSVALICLVNYGLFLRSRFPAKQHEAPLSPQATLGALRQWSVIQLCTVIFLYVFVETGLANFLAIYLYEFKGAPEGISIQSISYFWGIVLVGRLLCSLLPLGGSDRKLIVLMMMLGAAPIALSLLARDWGVALACFLAAGFFIAGLWPTIVALTAVRHKGYANTVVGVTVAVGSLGCIVCPPLMGFLFQVIDPAIAMSLLAIPLLAGGLIALNSPRVAGMERKVSRFYPSSGDDGLLI